MPVFDLRPGGVPAPNLWTPANLSPAPSIWLDAECDRTDRIGVERLVSKTSVAHTFRRGSGEAPGVFQAGSRDGFEFSPSHGSGSRLFCDEAAARNLTRAASYGLVLAVYRKTTSDTLQRILFYSSAGSAGGTTRFACLIGGDAPNNNRPGMIARRADGDSAGVLFDTADRGTDWQVVAWEINWATRRGRIFRNGAVVAESATLTTAGSATTDTQSASAVGFGAFTNDTSGGFLHPCDAEVAALVARFGTTPMTIDEIDRLFGWAHHAYGLADLLPTDHPFKSAAPTV